MDRQATVLRSEGLGHAEGSVGGPGQTIGGRLLPFVGRRRQERSKRAVIAAYDIKKQDRPEA